MTTAIAYSRGTSTYDAHPAQRSAATFDDFEAAVLSDRAAAKGGTYIAAPFKVNGDGRAHRCKEGTLPRAWLPFDLDGVRDAESYVDLALWLQRYRGFAYTTARSTTEVPRVRVIVAASRPVDRTEGQRVCLAIEAAIKAELGEDVAKFDRSVYRGEQPCYAPPLVSQTFSFAGAPVDVDAMLPTAPPIDDERPGVKDRAAAAATTDPILQHLVDNGMVKRELEPGRYAVDCPCADEHTSESGDTSTIYMLPNFGGVKYGKFHCLHAHCKDREQEVFIAALGLDPKRVWSAQANGGVDINLGPSGTATGNDRQAGGNEIPAGRFKAASGRLIELAYADELDGAAGEADESIERTLTRGAMSVLYGDSNSGKTFLALDIACSLTRGVTWMDRNVEPGAVVYLATESPSSIKLRLRAYQKHYGIVVPNLAIVGSPIDLYGSGDDTQAVIDLVRHVEDTRGVKVELIVGDTLSRLSAGANENSGEDMSVVVRHVDRIRNKCSAHFALIHHTGKDSAKGARGWSGLRAATDTEIEVTADDAIGIHAAEITKQRDIPGKGDRIGFRLQVVELGIGKWGKPVTSCVVVGTDAPPKAQSKRLSEIAGAITECLTSRGCGMKKRELVEHLSRYDSSAVYREIKKLCEADKLHVVAGIVGLRK